MAVFDISAAEKRFRERIESLELDTKRCYSKVLDLPFAHYPAVLYAFATINYFSSFWAGWNKKRPDPTTDQTKRIVGFLERYCKYGSKESTLAVKTWRHLLIHTGEPRILRNKNTGDVYVWEIHAEGTTHMKLDPIDPPGHFKFQYNPFTLVCDLRVGVLGPNGYLDELRSNQKFQANFDAFIQELEGYEIEL
jgi:hypothetical protein